MENVLIADDHVIIRRGIIMLMESYAKQFNFIEAATGAAAIKALSEQQISFAILDLSYADSNLFSFIDELEQFARKTNILVYSMNTERVYAKRLIGKGIKGYVSKQANIEELDKAIQSILRGEIYLSPSLKELLFSTIRTADFTGNPLDLLSDRELEVVEYLAAGMGTKEIARQMKVDITTISTYRRRAFEKLEVENVIELREKFMIYRT